MKTFAMISDLRHRLEHAELQRGADVNKWEHRIMRACAVLVALAVALKAAGLL